MIDEHNKQNVRLRNIDCGDNHTITLSEDGESFVWGFNGFGQLGVGDTQDRNKPTLINHNILSSGHSSATM